MRNWEVWIENEFKQYLTSQLDEKNISVFWKEFIPRRSIAAKSLVPDFSNHFVLP